MDARTDGLKLSLKLYHARELRLNYQQLITEAPLTALIIPPLLARIVAEEKLLCTQFGDEYNTCCAHTWRLIPGLY
jgi:protein-S-isoprenylcysteine O-methyltransferase Ste14